MLTLLYRRLLQWHEITTLEEKGYQLIDVRTADEYGRGHIPNSINIPIDEIRERSGEIVGKNLLAFCQVGQRGHTASLLLNELGYNAINLDGGYQTWSNSPAAKKVLST